ncbi:hypothetical protein DL96DRAFT_1607590 [Flagelloscypha sp. PMI_526]|nr:hypothetical protein DL96DRAFT_1607590 [Flagelloscypha sp. PMI_526]
MANQGLLSGSPSPTSQAFDPYTITERTKEAQTLETRPMSASTNRTAKWHIFCVLLHLSFALLHVTLVGVMNKQVERNVHVELGSKTTLWSTVIQILLQAYAIGYLAAALFVVQKLFMQRLLFSRQTLTKTHDEFNSLLGLGSSILTLAKQHYARSGFLSISLITLYLAASAVVKVTTSALFQLVPVSVETFQLANVTSMDPRDLVTDPGYPGGSSWLLYTSQPLEMQLLSLQSIDLNSYADPSLGLHQSILYDVISPLANATGEIEVNTYPVQVRCYETTQDWWSLVADNNLYEFPFALTSTQQYLDSVPRLTGVENQTYIVPVQMVNNITDDNGQQGTRIPLSNVTFWGAGNSTEDETWLLFSQGKPVADSFTCRGMEASFSASTFLTPANKTTIKDFGLAMCTVEVPQTKGFISTSQRSLIRNSLSPKRNGSAVLWTEMPYRLADTFSPLDGNFTNDLKLTDQCFEHAVVDGSFYSFDCWRADNNVKQNLRTPEFVFSRLVREYLSTLDNYHGQMTSWPSISLRDLEDALEHYFALSLFSRKKAMQDSKDSDAIKGLAARQYLTNASVISQVSELQLRGLPVYLGLAASVIMLAVALWIAFTTPLLGSPLDSFGVLQITWLSNGDIFLNGPAKPTEKKLRIAGLSTSIDFDTGIGKIRNRGSYDDAEDAKDSHQSRYE